MVRWFSCCWVKVGGVVVMAEAIKRGDGDSGCNHGEGLREGSEGDGVWRCGLCGWRFPHPSTRAIKGLVD
jgi:hypothetical protein